MGAQTRTRAYTHAGTFVIALTTVANFQIVRRLSTYWLIGVIVTLCVFM